MEGIPHMSKRNVPLKFMLDVRNQCADEIVKGDRLSRPFVLFAFVPLFFRQVAEIEIYALCRGVVIFNVNLVVERQRGKVLVKLLRHHGPPVAQASEDVQRFRRDDSVGEGYLLGIIPRVTKLIQALLSLLPCSSGESLAYKRANRKRTCR